MGAGAGSGPIAWGVVAPQRRLTSLCPMPSPKMWSCLPPQASVHPLIAGPRGSAWPVRFPQWVDVPLHPVAQGRQLHPWTWSGVSPAPRATLWTPHLGRAVLEPGQSSGILERFPECWGTVMSASCRWGEGGRWSTWDTGLGPHSSHVLGPGVTGHSLLWASFS